MKGEEAAGGGSGVSAPTVEAGGRYLTPWELKMQARTERLLLTWGSYESIKRFMRKISKVSTRFCYLLMLDQYLRWLRDAKGVTMDPDELVKDNLECVYNSPPTDVKTKRRHTDWLDEYVNDYLLKRGRDEARLRRRCREGPLQEERQPARRGLFRRRRPGRDARQGTPR